MLIVWFLSCFQSTALPSSRERADALRYALGASGANVDGLAEAGARPPTSKARLNLRFGNRPRDGGGGRTSGGGGSGTGMFPSFPLPRQASSPAMAFNPSRVVADISRAVKAKAHARLSRTSDGNHQFVDEAELGDDALSEWLPATTADGRAYFWNPVTRKARWTKLQPGAHSRSSHALLQSIDHTSSTTLGGVSAEVTKVRYSSQNTRGRFQEFWNCDEHSDHPVVRFTPVNFVLSAMHITLSRLKNCNPRGGATGLARIFRTPGARLKISLRPLLGAAALVYSVTRRSAFRKRIKNAVSKSSSEELPF